MGVKVVEFQGRAILLLPGGEEGKLFPLGFVVLDGKDPLEAVQTALRKTLQGNVQIPIEVVREEELQAELGDAYHLLEAEGFSFLMEALDRGVGPDRLFAEIASALGFQA